MEICFTVLYTVGFMFLLAEHSTNENESFLSFTYKVILLYMVYLILILK